MSLIRWLQARKPYRDGAEAKGKIRRSFRETTLPLISPRRGRRILRKEQLFSVVRESLIRAGILSSSYEFKVLALDSNGDGFLVLVDLALPGDVMPDEYLLEIERWIQNSARSRHSMRIPSVYWRRQAPQDQRGHALKAAVSAQTQRDMQAGKGASPANPPYSTEAPLARPRPMSEEEIKAFRSSLQSPAIPKHSMAAEADTGLGGDEHPPESHSDFSALSETQYGKL
ncbi:hypothetical protein LPB72_22250 [Hydrogenophaga crassostreae]|uniref:Uncharacterized protein n=1 Tax=Hydrogenophaga crassostreae TaxID=1763535 RepID=A0A162VNC7_9BURK|nr:hypothetical protein [Hydrogenophaga crassostreae]AOW15228.1 hypothetical protein LPB072_22865 [Hydrogenophaga crassostreae]OAD39316.1 hypothetical protein LPB72_22250 [Hydrogenophaga crassostreae]